MSLNTDSDSTTLPSPSCPTTSGSESHSTTLNLIDSNVDTLDAVLETVDEGETLVDEEETVSEVFQILVNLENGRIDDSLPRTVRNQVRYIG